MNDNYKPVRKFTDRLLREYYADIEKDLEEIVNAPSLLARTSKYYHLSHDDDVYFLVFVYDGQIWFIKEWTIVKFLNHKSFEKSLEYYCESTLGIIYSDPIMYQGGLR